MMSDSEMRLADTSNIEESVVTSIVDGKLNTSWASSVRKYSADFTAASASSMGVICNFRRASIDMGEKFVNTYIASPVQVDNLSNSTGHISNLVPCQVTPILNEHESFNYNPPVSNQAYNTCQVTNNNISPPVSNGTCQPSSNITGQPINNIIGQPISNTMCLPITSTIYQPISNNISQPHNGINDYSNIYSTNNNTRQINNNISSHVNNATCQFLSNITGQPINNINDFNINNGYQVEVMLPIKATITFTTEVPLNAINPGTNINATIPLTGQVPFSANIPFRASLPLDVYNTTDLSNNQDTIPKNTQRRASITEGLLFNHMNTYAHLRTQSMLNPSPQENYDLRYHSYGNKK